MANSALANADDTVLDFLRREGEVGIACLTTHLGVTATAVRQRLNRLMRDGLVERSAEKHGRGRPSHKYRLTDKGRQAAGDSYGELVDALWEEVRGIEDPAIQRGLLQRLATRLAERYTSGGEDQGDASGTTVGERMRLLQQQMRERHIPFDVDESGDLPVLNALACPFPDVANHDRSVCTMEQMMISEVLGETVTLAECRLDGGSCCSFTPSAAEAS